MGGFCGGGGGGGGGGGDQEMWELDDLSKIFD